MDPATIESVAREVAKQSSSHGGEIWISSLILVIVGLLGGLAAWKIWIPNAVSTRENSAKLAEVVAAMGQVTAKTHEFVSETHVTAGDINSRLKRVTACMRVETRAIEKVADKTGVDLRMEIGQMRGLLGGSESTESM